MTLRKALPTLAAAILTFQTSVIAGLGLMAWAQQARAASYTGCNAAVLGGAAVSSTEVTIASAVSVDGLSGDGWAAGVGAGCAYQFPNGFAAGVDVNYIWQRNDFEVKAGGATLFRAGIDTNLELLARAGFVSGSTWLYGLAGYSWADVEWKLPGGGAPTGLPTKFRGPVVGLGIEHALPIGNGNVRLKLEGRASFYDEETIAGGFVKIEPTDYQVLAGLSLWFGGPAPETPASRSMK